MEKDDFMKRLQIESFAMTDTLLYLDTHPTDQKALAYYRKYRAMYEKTLKDYVADRGPISPWDVQGNSWTWVETPWPWEGSAR